MHPKIHVKWGASGTDLQKGVIGYRFAKKGVNEYKEAKFAQIHIINGTGNSLSMYHNIPMAYSSINEYEARGTVLTIQYIAPECYMFGMQPIMMYNIASKTLQLQHPESNLHMYQTIHRFNS